MSLLKKFVGEEMMKKYLLMSAVTSIVAFGAVADSFRPEVLLNEASEVASESFDERIQRSRESLALRAKNDPLVLDRFDQLVEHVKRIHLHDKALSQDQVFLIFDALDFAAEKHEGQTRRNKAKTPYISHPIGVTNILMTVGEVKDSALIIAGLLHDTVEGTQTSLEEISKKFGKDVAQYVKEVSHDKDLSAEERKRIQVIEASHKSSGAAQINFADKLYNLNDLLTHRPEGWSQERIDRYFEWAESVVNRLPATNPELKQAVDQVIDQYWESQNPSSSKRSSTR